MKGRIARRGGFYLVMPSERNFGHVLRRLRAERGLSRARLSHLAFHHSQTGTSEAQLKAIESGARYPSPRTIEAVAAVLELDPWELPEYQLAMARRTLDERQVGLERALRNLEALGGAERVRSFAR